MSKTLRLCTCKYTKFRITFVCLVGEPHAVLLYSWLSQLPPSHQEPLDLPEEFADNPREDADPSHDDKKSRDRRTATHFFTWSATSDPKLVSPSAKTAEQLFNIIKALFESMWTTTILKAAIFKEKHPKSSMEAEVEFYSFPPTKYK
jgi:hypothetical protein